MELHETYFENSLYVFKLNEENEFMSHFSPPFIEKFSSFLSLIISCVCLAFIHDFFKKKKPFILKPKEKKNTNYAI